MSGFADRWMAHQREVLGLLAEDLPGVSFMRLHDLWGWGLNIALEGDKPGLARRELASLTSHRERVKRVFSEWERFSGEIGGEEYALKGYDRAIAKATGKMGLSEGQDSVEELGKLLRRHIPSATCREGLINIFSGKDEEGS